jgi:plastocyanin
MYPALVFIDVRDTERTDAAVRSPQTRSFRLKAILPHLCGSRCSRPAAGEVAAGSRFNQGDPDRVKFDPSTITVPHGKVVLNLINAGTVSHDLIIRDSVNNRVGGSELVSAGDTFVFTIANLSVGSYTFFCDQPGHESSGMKGTLTASP